jgi:hypothetical protein
MSGKRGTYKTARMKMVKRAVFAVCDGETLRLRYVI